MIIVVTFRFKRLNVKLPPIESRHHNFCDNQINCNLRKIKYLCNFCPIRESTKILSSDKFKNVDFLTLRKHI